MTDVLLYQTNDGGEVTVANGQMATTEGLDTAALLSCFGGNSDDGGLAADDSKQWWANLIEDDPQAILRSQTQELLETLTLTPSNLQRFEEAMAADLAWLQDTGIVDSIATDASMPGVDRVQLTALMVVNGKPKTFKFSPPKATP